MNPQRQAKPVEILLVEDNPGDARLTLEALKNSKLKNNLNVVHDGEEALEYLRKQGDFAHAKRPDLILLDLNLPKKDGREVLVEIKNDPEFKSIPVAVLTSSDDQEDVIKAYESHANCYIKKPVNLNEFMKVVEQVENFWFQIVILPPN